MITQMVRIFDMNPKVEGSCPSQVETFSVSKILTLSQEHPFVLEMNTVARTQLTFPMLTLLKKYQFTTFNGCTVVVWIG